MAERKLASIQRIIEILPHPNADRLELAKILGWQAVVIKNDFKKGDLVVYIETDAVLPEGNPEWQFMKERGFRVRTVKFRGALSQGLVFHLTILPPLNECYEYRPLEVGEDVTERLKITKYEPNIPANLAGKVKGNFPNFLKKTDEQRIQSCPDVLERHKGKWFIVTEKLDGSSFTAYLNKGVFGVCSRNLELQEDDCSTIYWKVAKELDLKSKLESLGGNWAIQGELIGQGIQKNKYGLSNVQLKLFNIFNIDTGKYLNQDEFVITSVLLKLDMVPALFQVCLENSMDEIIEMSKGSSKLNSKIPREGIVFRPEQEMWDEELGRLSFKCVNPDFLLKYDSE